MTRYERQVRRLLLAYPSVWRAERGEEMVGTILDLGGDGQRRVSPRLALDLLVGGWSERARHHLRLAGPLAAGWRLAVSVAIVAQLAVSLVWLRDWALTATPAILVTTLGGASAVSYGVALGGFVIGAAAWVAGLRRTARIAGGVAIASWVLTVGVFHALSNPMMIDWFEIVVWTYLAAFATIGLFQPPPSHRRVVGVVAIALALAAQLLSTGATPLSSVGTLVVFEQTITISLLDRGVDTLHTALRTSWALFAIAGLALVRIDPRPAVAACWLFPFLALDHLAWGGQIGLTTGIVVGVAVLAVATMIARPPGSGRDLLA